MWYIPDEIRKTANNSETTEVATSRSPNSLLYTPAAVHKFLSSWTILQFFYIYTISTISQRYITDVDIAKGTCFTTCVVIIIVLAVVVGILSCVICVIAIFACKIYRYLLILFTVFIDDDYFQLAGIVLSQVAYTDC